MARNEEIGNLVEQLAGLPTPAPVLVGLRRLAGRGGVGQAELAELYGLDPALSCQILRDAAGSRRAPGADGLPTLEQAARSLTVERLLAMLPQAAKLRHQLRRNGDGLSADDAEEQDRSRTIPLEDDRPEAGLWGHAVGTALGCRLIAEHLGDVSPAAAHLAGLLHDLGKDTLGAASRSTLRQVRVCAARERLPYSEAERRCGVLGHTELGRRLARRWALPTVLQEVMLTHHEPNPVMRSANPMAARLIDVVILGDAMARRLRLGNPMDPLGSPAWGALTRKRLGIDREVLNQLSLQLSRAFGEVLHELLGRSAGATGSLTRLPGSSTELDAGGGAGSWVTFAG